jgi:Coenzyme PQQ synthesis protein D (PqqD)
MRAISDAASSTRRRSEWSSDVNLRYSAITFRFRHGSRADSSRPESAGTVYSRRYMHSVSLDNTFILSKDAVFRDLHGEAVILDLGSGTYFGLNTVGTRIWQLIEQHGRLKTVFDELCREYDAAPGELERDLLELVARLADVRLVEAKSPS